MTKLTDSDLNETANLLKDLTRKFSEKLMSTFNRLCKVVN